MGQHTELTLLNRLHRNSNEDGLSETILDNSMILIVFSNNYTKLVGGNRFIITSVFINDNEGGLLHDYEKWLEELAPHAPTTQYDHNNTGEDNADAHLKRQVMGREIVVAITNGKLDFGPWEEIFYGEFDGKRPKRVLVKIIGE